MKQGRGGHAFPGSKWTVVTALPAVTKASVVLPDCTLINRNQELRVAAPDQRSASLGEVAVGIRDVRVALEPLTPGLVA